MAQNATYGTSSLEPEEPSLGGRLDFKLVITRQLSTIATTTDLEAFPRLVHNLIILLTPYFDEKTKNEILAAQERHKDITPDYVKKVYVARDWFTACVKFLDEKGLLLKKAEETIEL